MKFFTLSPFIPVFLLLKSTNVNIFAFVREITADPISKVQVLFSRGFILAITCKAYQYAQKSVLTLKPFQILNVLLFSL